MRIGSRRALGLLALPALTVAATDAFAFAVACSGGPLNTAESAAIGIFIALALTPLALVSIAFVRVRARDKVLLATVLICASALAIFVGSVALLEAMKIACHAATDCPFG
jgi:hypothetical protein